MTINKAKKSTRCSKKIKVSVLIVNYNNSKYIKKCINSVLNQNYPIKEFDCRPDDFIKNIEQNFSNKNIIYKTIINNLIKLKNVFLEHLLFFNIVNILMINHTIY